MNAGELRYSIEILELNEITEMVWEWRPKTAVPAKLEHQTASNLFSKNGLSAKSIKATIREYPALTLHNAFKLTSQGGEHCFLSDIDKDMRSHYVLTAALIEPVICTIDRVKTVKGELNRPETLKLPQTVFPGFLTEKYTRQEQREPMSHSEVRFILVAPKFITIAAGQLVNIGGEPYEVLIPHNLDEYKNEYEILRRVDN